MKKISFIFESCKEAIRVTYVGFICIAIGFLIQNESINVFYTFKSTFILVTAEFLYKFGECIVINLPLIFMLNLVCKKSHSAFPLISALIGYFAFMVATMIFAPTSLDSSAYINNSFITSSFGLTSGSRLPLNTGMVGSFIVAFITRYTFIRSRHNSMAYKNSYFDRDVFGIFFNVILCVIAGLVISFVYPILFEQVQNLFKYISNNSKDSISLGIYGFFDRLFSIMGIPNIIKDPFYFTSLGGSYTANNGTIIVGDANIWEFTKDISDGYAGAGKFMTAYYIINIFIVPCFYFGIYKSITNKKEKSKFSKIFLLISLFSIVCGNPLPMELFLLFSAPVLLLLYLFVVASTFALTNQFEIYLGSNISSMNPWIAMPGNMPDYLINLRNVYHSDAIRSILILGIFAAIFSLIISLVYFKSIAADANYIKSKRGLMSVIYEAIGGWENIKVCTSGLYRIMIIVNDIKLMDIDKIKAINASKIFETKDGINIDVGTSAYIISKTINKDIKDKIKEKDKEKEKDKDKDKEKESNSKEKIDKY